MENQEITALNEELRVYTTEEIASVFKKNIHTIRRWIHSGKLKAQKIGGLYYVNKKELDGLFGPEPQK